MVILEPLGRKQLVSVSVRSTGQMLEFIHAVPTTLLEIQKNM